MISSGAISSLWKTSIGQQAHLKRRFLAAAAAASSSDDEAVRPGTRTALHFRESRRPHPLKTDRVGVDPFEGLSSEERDKSIGDHTGRQQNHIWSDEALEKALGTAHHVHEPQSFGDRLAHAFMYYGLYHPFNFITGYRQDDPSPNSIEWRLIILESFAGVPGFVAAGFRHFHSLRVLERDHGWIYTLLEEAENERMHLLTCLKMFDASIATRVLCVGAQVTMTPLLMATYVVSPRTMHRFVGYLEQTACATYFNIIMHCETPGTKLHEAWAHLPAPAIAIGYWKLKENARWVDALKCMYADETHHRDINHTFASMSSDDPNPFISKHKEYASQAWRLEQEEEQQRKRDG